MRRSFFSLYKYRLELLYKLRRKGFYVRMHAYEYLLGFEGRIIGVLLLEPRRNEATLWLSPKVINSERIYNLINEALMSIDPTIKVRRIT